MMDKLIEVVFSGILQFVGFVILVFLAMLAFECVLEAIYKGWRLLLRHASIWVRGWPPEHLDADGDYRKPPEPFERPIEHCKHCGEVIDQNSGDYCMKCYTDLVATGAFRDQTKPKGSP